MLHIRPSIHGLSMTRDNEFSMVIFMYYLHTKLWKYTHNQNIFHSKSLPQKYGHPDGYHSKCYSNFTAVPKIASKGKGKSLSTIPESSEGHMLRSSLPSMASDSSGVFSDKCICCPYTQRKLKENKCEYLTTCETLTSEESVIQVAKNFND